MCLTITFAMKLTLQCKIAMQINLVKRYVQKHFSTRRYFDDQNSSEKALYVVFVNI